MSTTNRWPITAADRRRHRGVNTDTTDLRYVIHPNFHPQTLVEGGDGVRHLFAAFPEVVAAFDAQYGEPVSWGLAQFVESVKAFQNADPALSQRDYLDRERDGTVWLWQQHEMIVSAPGVVRHGFDWAWRAHLNRALLTIL